MDSNDDLSAELELRSQRFERLLATDLEVDIRELALSIEAERRPAALDHPICKLDESIDTARPVGTAHAYALRSLFRFTTDSDDEFRRVFSPFGITDIGIATFEDRRLRYDSQERGLLRRALVAAIARTHEMDVRSRGTSDILAPQSPADPAWQSLRDVLGGPIHGTVPKYRDISWREGIGLRLDWASDNLWLLLEPRIVFDCASEETKAITSDFARERTVRRYNPILDRLIQSWSERFAGEGLRAFAIGDGLDAAFDIDRKSAHSWAAKP